MLNRSVAVDSHVTGTCFSGEMCVTMSRSRHESVPENERSFSTFGAWRISRGSTGACGNTTANSGSKREKFATCGGRVPDQNRGGRPPNERNKIIKNKDTNDSRQVKRSSNKFQCHRVERWRSTRKDAQEARKVVDVELPREQTEHLT